MLVKVASLLGATAYDWSGLDLAPVTTNFFQVVPIAIGVVIALIAFRKAWGFLVGQIKRA